MYKVWYWTLVDRDSEGRFIASIPDLVDVAAYGASEKDALANVTQLAEEHVRALVESGQLAPRPSPASEHAERHPVQGIRPRADPGRCRAGSGDAQARRYSVHH